MKRYRLTIDLELPGDLTDDDLSNVGELIGLTGDGGDGLASGRIVGASVIEVESMLAPSKPEGG